LLYGCDVAQGVAGQAFITAFANATQVSVAASTDLSGAASLGGNWALEANVSADGHLIINDVALAQQIAPVVNQLATYDAVLAAPMTASSIVTVATGHDYLSATTPNTTPAPLNALGVAGLSDGSRVVLLANTRAEYYDMANLDNLQVALVASNGNVTKTSLSGTVATIVNDNGNTSHNPSNTLQTNDGAGIVALSDGFVVTSYSNDGYGVQMYTNAGVSKSITAPTNYAKAAVMNPNARAIATSDGGFVLLWTLNNGDTLDYQRYKSDGSLSGTTYTQNLGLVTKSFSIQGAAVDASGNLAVPLSASDVNTRSQVLLFNTSNALVGTYDTAYYQPPL